MHLCKSTQLYIVFVFVRRAPPIDDVEDEKDDEEEEEESEVDEQYETLQEEDLEYLKKTSGTTFLAGIDTK